MVKNMTMSTKNDDTHDPRPKDPSVAGRKKRLRAEMHRRLEAEPDDPASAERRRRNLLSLPEVSRARGILACLSFGTEVDTWGLVDHWLAEGRRVYAPRSDHRDKQIYAHPYPCELRTLSFGLRQPSRKAPMVPSDEVDARVDLVLVLGLAFDREGIRLGHGSGYFDRFLAGRSFAAVAFARSLQMLADLPREEHDVPMTAVVTEDGIFRP